MGIFRDLAEANLINNLDENNTSKTVIDAAIYEAMDELEDDSIFDELDNMELAVTYNPNISEMDKKKISSLCNKVKRTTNLKVQEQIMDEINNLIDKINGKL